MKTIPFYFFISGSADFHLDAISTTSRIIFIDQLQRCYEVHITLMDVICFFQFLMGMFYLFKRWYLDLSID